MRQRRARGVVLIAALFLTLFMAILATHLFYLKMSEHRASALHAQELQAWAAAQAGLDDAKVKLLKDRIWPPMTADQDVYFYSDRMIWNGQVVATYRVAVERPEANRVDLTVWGVVGDVAAPAAQRQMQASFDPATGRLTKFVDYGSF